VIPVAGYYRVELGVRSGLTASQGTLLVSLTGTLGVSQEIGTSSGNTNARTLIQTQYYNVGDLVFGNLWSSPTGSATIVRNYLHITYLPN